MNELKVFENQEFGKVRIVEIDGNVWFVAADICRALEITNPTMAMERLDNDEKAKFNLGLSGGNTNCVNEYGLYNLVLASRKKEAKEFKRWITHTVIPSIRKNGGYIVNQENLTPEQIVANALVVAQKIIADRDKQIMEMNNIISELEPKASYYDKILESKDTVLTTQIAKDYGMSAKGFNKKLHDLCVQYKVGEQWVLYSKYQGKGYTKSKTHSFQKNDGSYGTAMQTEWTQKGRLFLYDFLKQHGTLPLMEQEN